MKAMYLIALILGHSVAARAESSLFVRIEDLSPSGTATYEGADIDAVELLAPGGTAAYYAAAVVDSRRPQNASNAGVRGDAMLGQPVLLDGNAPYVFALNGGWVVARITLPNPVEEGWRLTVYEIDGMLYPGQGLPEPYRVSMAEQPDGPWKVLGIGSGTSRFMLDGGSKQQFDDELVERIEASLRKVLDNEPATESQRTSATAFFKRLQSVEDLKQLQVELVALHAYFTSTEHAVNEHREKDGGRVVIARELLRAAYQRYRGITGA